MSFIRRTKCCDNTYAGHTRFVWQVSDYKRRQANAFGISSSNLRITDTDDMCRFDLEFTWPNNHITVYVNLPHCTNSAHVEVIVSVIDKTGKTGLTLESRGAVDNHRLKFSLKPDSTALLNNTDLYVSNDTLTLFCEITKVIKPVLNTRDAQIKDCITVFQESLKLIFEDKSYSDVTFVVQDQHFRAHKVVLAAHSPVLKAMFDTKMAEQVNNTVQITDIDASTFEVFLRYMYSGCVKNIENLVGDLLTVADKYQVATLQKICEMYAGNHLCLDNAIHYLLLAEMHSYQKLKNKALIFMKSNIQEIVDSVDFNKLCKYPHLVAALFLINTDGIKK